MWSIRVLAVGLLCGVASPGWAADTGRNRTSAVFEAESETAVGGLSVEELREEEARLSARLTADLPRLAPELGLQVALTDEDRVALGEEPARDEMKFRDHRMLVGRVKSLGHDVVLAAADTLRPGRQVAGGLIASGADGARLWITRVSSPGAGGLRLRLDRLDLPEGAQLFVFNDRGEAHGPYTGRRGGARWSHTMTGESVYVELRAAATRTESGAPIRFRIADVVHLSPRYPLVGGRRLGSTELEGEELCGYNADCVVNAECIVHEPQIEDIGQPGYVLFSNLHKAKKGIAHIQFVSGANTYICTGGLLNSWDVTSVTPPPGTPKPPYFLTANHCLSTDAEAASLEAFWQYTTPCGGGCYTPQGDVPSTVGSSVVKTSPIGDFTLLLLDTAPPAGSTFMGWSASPVAFTAGSGLYRLSHPKGAPLAYTAGWVNTTALTCQGRPRGGWIYGTVFYGANEGGSSGSPVMNDDGKVVGQLTGACGLSPEEVCNSDDNRSIDGALASYFSEVQGYLTGEWVMAIPEP